MINPIEGLKFAGKLTIVAGTILFANGIGTVIPELNGFNSLITGGILIGIGTYLILK